MCARHVGGGDGVRERIAKQEDEGDILAAFFANAFRIGGHVAEAFGQCFGDKACIAVVGSRDSYIQHAARGHCR